MAACEQAYAEVAEPDPWMLRTDGGAPAPGYYLVYTRGDEVASVGASGLGAFLAPIDASDAAYLARVAARADVDCAAPSVMVVAGGHEVFVTQTATCGGQATEMRVLVDEAGAATVVESVVTREGEDIICP